MKYGISTRRTTDVSSPAGQDPLIEALTKAMMEPITEPIAPTDRLWVIRPDDEMEEVDQAALAELVEFAARPL